MIEVVDLPQGACVISCVDATNLKKLSSSEFKIDNVNSLGIEILIDE